MQRKNNFALVCRELDMSLSDGTSDEDLPSTLPRQQEEEEGRLNGSIRKVRTAGIFEQVVMRVYKL